MMIKGGLEFFKYMWLLFLGYAFATWASYLIWQGPGIMLKKEWMKI